MSLKISTNRRKAKKAKKLPAVRGEHDRVIAILCSDLHLSDKPPIVRSAEPDWLAAQKRVLDQLQELSEKLCAPIIIAGDIFDKPQVSSELVNFAIEHLPQCYTIPGQHDLLHHSYDDIEKTSYWTLVKAKAVENLTPYGPPVGLQFYASDDQDSIELFIHAFPWGFDLKDADRKTDDLHLAVVHKYCYAPNLRRTMHPGAKLESSAAEFAENLRNFDVVAVGDNHTPFVWSNAIATDTGIDLTIFNCGSLMRRKADEINHKPRVGLLHFDSYVSSHELDCSQDKFIDVSDAVSLVEKALDITEFLDELRALGDKGLDFVAAVKRFCTDNNVDRGTVKVILEALK